MQVSMMDLVLGLPASLKCPHRKHSTSAAGMGPCRQGDTLYLCLGTAARANSLELPHVLTWGRSDSHPASLKYENSRVKNEADLLKTEEVKGSTHSSLDR